MMLQTMALAMAPKPNSPFSCVATVWLQPLVGLMERYVLNKCGQYKYQEVFVAVHLDSQRRSTHWQCPERL